MKVAILSPIAWRTPPLKYGPWEQVASNIAEGLIDMGIDVTLFATGNSVTRGNLQSVSETAYSENPEMDPKVWECLHISNLMEQADNYDIIHNHYDFLPLTYTRLVTTPMVTTIHGFSSQKILEVYKKYDNESHYVSVSNSDRSPLLHYTATVYNGINEKEFTFREKSGDHLLYFGRIHPEKGAFEAIQIAKKSGVQLILSGIIQDQEYYDEKIRPSIDDDSVVFVGNSGPAERDRLMGEARALLHPISFKEPFGLSVAESMMCGTPVIAFNLGSMPELILPGKTGFLVDTVDEAVRAVAALSSVSRKSCRDWAYSEFRREKMIHGYLNVYERILHMQNRSGKQHYE